ncbi:MAG: 30S ribosomal protein S15 [Coleofasciculaceae cyanobacterium RL_1_1]|jgi:small subunit ribosomal protein S15|nr:30S ribosomal protein S15 [Coleofasciculaceae cyanobacterium RL_1_1]
MSLTQVRKQEIMTDFQTHETDTGSAEVQIAMLSERISKLSLHLQANKKDYASQRGLMKMLGHRKSLLGYVRKKDETKYRELLTRLGIRG